MSAQNSTYSALCGCPVLFQDCTVNSSTTRVVPKSLQFSVSSCKSHSLLSCSTSSILKEDRCPDPIFLLCSQLSGEEGEAEGSLTEQSRCECTCRFLQSCTVLCSLPFHKVMKLYGVSSVSYFLISNELRVCQFILFSHMYHVYRV